MPSVSFQNADAKPLFSGKAKLKKFIPELFSTFNFNLDSVTFIFCSDEYLLHLNRQFLDHDYYTDILTFDLSSNKSIAGEIYISIDRVKENARDIRTSFQNEMMRVIFHGVLHLCGLKDKTRSQKRKMTEKEDDALVKFAAFHVKQ